MACDVPGALSGGNNCRLEGRTSHGGGGVQGTNSLGNRVAGEVALGSECFW